MKFPPALVKGDCIGITCPSGFLDFSKTVLAKETLEKWGFSVFIGKTVGSSYYYFSEKDEIRLEDLQAQLDNPKIKAILMGRGGYGLSRIIDQLDFTKFRQHPKWVIGFSDITVLHSHLNNYLNIASIHGPMCSAFQGADPEPLHITSLYQALTNQPIHYPIPKNEQNKPGKGKGIVLGGNLAILSHLMGSVSEIQARDKILFLEDVGEYYYNIDRMLLQLKRAGVFQNIQGLILGGFTEMKDTDRPFGHNIYEIIRDKVRSLKIPVCFNFPAGHIDQNYALILGKEMELVVDNDLTVHFFSSSASS